MRDTEFDARFEQAVEVGFKYLIARILGKHKPPTLEGYRDHLLAGTAIGALPVEGAPPRSVDELDKLAVTDFDAIAHAIPKVPFALHTAEEMITFIKLKMDSMAGKVSYVEFSPDHAA